MTIRAGLAALALAAGLAFSVLSPSAHAEAGYAGEATSQTLERQIMVMIRIGPDHFRAGSDYGGDYGDAVGQRMRLRFAGKIARDNGLRILENWPMQLIGVDCVIMAIEDGRSPQDVAEAISKLPGVEWSQPLNRFEMQAARPRPYNDKLYPAQRVTARWNLASMHRVATGRGVSVAIIDSRIDTAHPDLSGQNITIEDFVPGNRNKAESHGTGVAGIIAARPNNAIGIAGVAPGARIFGLRACWERKQSGATVCDSLSLAKALTSALERKVDVVNLSLTGPRDRLLSTLLHLAMARGIIVVAAVDADRPQGSFPASVEGVIRVSDESLSASSGNVYIAPGLDIPTTQPEGKWSLVNGSSYATAHVSGLAALLKQLSGSRRSRMVNASAFGPAGPIDACAAIARLSEFDAGACKLRH